jgi:hypothetical protein
MSTAVFRKPPAGVVEHRFADFKAESYDADARTVEAVLSVGAAVQRAYGSEVLSINAGAVNLERLTTCGIPLIDSHNIFGIGGVFGRLVRAWFDRGRLMGLLAFDDSENGKSAEGLVSRGTVRGISIGYRVDEWEVTDDEGDVVDPGRLRGDGEYTFTAKRWELLEVSLVSVPADPNAFVRSFGSSASIGAVAVSAIRARMWARQRIAEGNHNNEDRELSQPVLRRRPTYPGRYGRGGT